MKRRLRKGSRLGKYRLERLIGEGGTATVWQARDTIEGRRVAVKVVPPSVVEQFGRDAIEGEARTGARLDHPRVAGIRNANWIDDCFVIVTELARTSLDHYTGARRSPAVALSIFRDVAEGLAYAHEQGLIHRDIKPGNILLYGGRRAKLGDFGTARLAPNATRMLTEVGTFGYMAPEQAYGRPRFASDVFSLALTGYEMWTGVLPSWPFEWPLSGADRFVKRCPKSVQPVIRRGLELDLKKRWPDGVEFFHALLRAIDQVEEGEKRARGFRKSTARTSRRYGEMPEPFALETSWFRRRFGKQFEAHFDCYACDGPIAESMSHCPWCGTTRNSFAEVTTFPLICPDCERGVRPEWGACPKCSTGRFEPNGKEIPADHSAERTCGRSGCEARIRRFTRYCPACKFKVERPWKVEGLDSCSRCRWPVASRWRFCGWCGKKNAGAMDVSVGRKRR